MVDTFDREWTFFFFLRVLACGKGGSLSLNSQLPSIAAQGLCLRALKPKPQDSGVLSSPPTPSYTNSNY